MPAVVMHQHKAWHRRDGVFLYFEDNRRDRQSEGRDEGLCNRRAGSKGMGECRVISVFQRSCLSWWRVPVRLRLFSYLAPLGWLASYSIASVSVPGARRELFWRIRLPHC